MEMRNVQEGWSLVSHFWGNCLLLVGFASESNDDALIARRKKAFVEELAEISQRMMAFGDPEASKQVDEILGMANECDFSEKDQVQAIDDKILQCNPAAREVRDLVQKMEKERNAQGPA